MDPSDRRFPARKGSVPAELRRHRLAVLEVITRTRLAGERLPHLARAATVTSARERRLQVVPAGVFVPCVKLHAQVRPLADAVRLHAGGLLGAAEEAPIDVRAVRVLHRHAEGALVALLVLARALAG